MEPDPSRVHPKYGDSVDFASLYGIGDVRRVDQRERSARRPPSDRLKVVIGVTEEGTPLWLDLRSSAEGGAGPHGLILGSIASGKSELVQSIVLGLVADHTPQEVNFVFAQSMGGDTFDCFRGLPHVLDWFPSFDFEDDRSALCKRLFEVVAGQVHSRMKYLHARGGFEDFSDYLRTVRPVHPSQVPTAALVVIIDEFAHLAGEYKREFLDMIELVGKYGKIAGVHLLLTTGGHQPDALRALASVSSYRIVLHSYSRNESREFLGVEDAADLPRDRPGLGYLRVGTGPLCRFQGLETSYRVRQPDVDPSDDFGISFAAALATELKRTAPPVYFGPGFATRIEPHSEPDDRAQRFSSHSVPRRVE